MYKQFIARFYLHLWWHFFFQEGYKMLSYMPLQSKNLLKFLLSLSFNPNVALSLSCLFNYSFSPFVFHIYALTLALSLSSLSQYLDFLIVTNSSPRNYQNIHIIKKIFWNLSITSGGPNMELRRVTFCCETFHWVWFFFPVCENKDKHGLKDWLG